MQDSIRFTSHNHQRESRKSRFYQLRVPTLPLLRKRRVSITRMGVWQAYTSNHGTKPKVASPTRYIAGSLPSMSTATVTAPITTQYVPTNTTTPPPPPKAATSGKATAAAASPMLGFPVIVERDEIWVQQLEEEQRQRFEIQARVMYKEYLAHLDSAGPFATTETREDLRQKYEERLQQIEQMQQEELEQLIEMERQERLWSLGQQDNAWDGWRRVYEEQMSIYAKIKRDAQLLDASGGEKSKEDMIRENEREREEQLRRSEEFQKYEPWRSKDRQQWAERTRLTNFHIEERRQRDLADAVAHQAEQRAKDEQSTRLREEARQGASNLRARTSHAALNTEFEGSRRPTPVLSAVSETSSRVSTNDSIFSSSPTTDSTPASSVYNERWRPSETGPTRPSVSRSMPIPVPASDDKRRSSSGSFSGSSPPSRARQPTAGVQSPSPLSGTPTSNTMAHAKGEEPPKPALWIPPETAREPTRKGSMSFEGSREPAPARKTSMLFGASPGPPPPPSLEEPTRRSQPRNGPTPQPTLPFSNPSTGARQPQSQPQQTRSTPSPKPPSQAPNAPGMRPQPLPQTQPQPQFGPASTSQTRQNTSSLAQPPFSSSFSAAPSNMGPKATPSPMNMGHKPAPEARPTPKPTNPPSADEHRTKLREQYTAAQEQRAEEERRRREEEANERRAEDARRRGAEKRKQEEQAREAERREAERKARKTSNPNVPPAPDRSVIEVWTAYESQWAAMATASQLRFRSIPWPVLSPVTSPETLLPIHIAAFILHPLHSQGKARKDRLREALLRWHPDRFEAKWLKKVVEEERDTVQEGVGLVVRALNDLMSTEGTFSA